MEQSETVKEKDDSEVKAGKEDSDKFVEIKKEISRGDTATN